MKRLVVLLVSVISLLFLASCPAPKSEPSVQARLSKAFESDSFAAAYSSRHLIMEGPFARMVIRKLGVDLIVAEGTTGESLRGGAGHYMQTAYPGDVGNMAIAGARVTLGEPFRHMDQLREGDEIELIVPMHRFIYRVVPAFGGHANPWITGPNDLSTLDPTDYAALTLTTTDPPHSSKNRLILRLRLERSEPIPR